MSKMRRQKRPRKTTTGREAAAGAALVIFGLAAGLIFIEAGLRLAGILYGLPQALMNRSGAAVDYRVMTLGESTTAGARNWPYFLELMLNAESRSKRYKVYNAAVPGTSTPFILAKLEDDLERHSPDLVVTMVGINDDYDDLYWTGAPRGGWLTSLRLYKLLRRFQRALTRRRGAGSPAADDESSADVWLARGRVHMEEGRLDAAEQCLTVASRLRPGAAETYEGLAQVYRRKGASKEFIKRFLSRNLRYLRAGERRPAEEVTRYHYRELHEALERKGIRHVAMQYPNKPLAELKKNLGEAKGVVFAGNEANFARALREGRYEDYFTDRFAVVFGHTTDEGSRLIAESAADAVLKLVEGRSRDAAPAQSGDARPFNVVDELIKRHPKQADLHIDRARQALLENDAPAARKALARAEALGMGAELSIRAARLYGRLGDEPGAFAAWNRAAGSGRMGADEWMERARAAESVKNAKAAAESLKRAKALRTSPEQRKRIEAFAAKIPRIGREMVEVPDPTAPEKMRLRRVADVSLWIERAAAAVKSGERGAALAHLKKAESLSPDPRWRREIVTLYGNLGEREKERAALESLIAAAPEDAGPRRRLALMHQEAGRYDLAAAVFRRLAREKGADAGLYREKGVCEYLSGSADAAVADLREAIRLAPLELDAYRDLGMVLESRGRAAEAVEIYERALHIPAKKGDADTRGMIRGARERLSKK